MAIQSLFFSRANAPFLVERHSGDEFDKLEPDSKSTRHPDKVPWIVIDNSSGSCSTLVAKGLNLFGIQDNNQRLVSILEVGQRTIFNPSSPTDKSPTDAPFLVERHSGDRFDELEQPDLDLFENNLCYRYHQSLLPTKSIGEYDVVIPMTPHGLLINVAKVKKGGIAFLGYRQFT